MQAQHFRSLFLFFIKAQAGLLINQFRQAGQIKRFQLYSNFNSPESSITTPSHLQSSSVNEENADKNTTRKRQCILFEAKNQ